LRWLRDSRHRARLRRLGEGKTPDYHRYLGVQLTRTLGKRSTDSGIGLRVLIDHLVELGSLGDDCSVLCIGCRNGVELDYLGSKGLRDVVGIDIFSQRSDILVMDMHAMTFPDDRFDAVLSSHSLEHSLDPAAVAAGIARVARDGAVVGVEVPLRVRQTDADMIEFANLEQLESVFAAHIGELLWRDEQPARSPTNDQGTEIGRIVLRLA
jgi:SAM-dependent methyltransferase